MTNRTPNETLKESVTLLQLIDKSAVAKWTVWAAIGAICLFGIGYLPRFAAELLH